MWWTFQLSWRRDTGLRDGEDFKITGKENRVARFFGRTLTLSSPRRLGFVARADRDIRAWFDGEPLPVKDRTVALDRMVEEGAHTLLVKVVAHDEDERWRLNRTHDDVAGLPAHIAAVLLTPRRLRSRDLTVSISGSRAPRDRTTTVRLSARTTARLSGRCPT